jgi:hypothetical protein
LEVWKVRLSFQARVWSELSEKMEKEGCGTVVLVVMMMMMMW